MSITLTYFKYFEEHAEKFGNVVVLMQVGSFYEIYEYDPEKDKSDNLPSWPNKKIGIATEMGPLLNLTLTRRDKSKSYSLINCNMVGFPMVALEKYKESLLINEYTVILVNQTEKDSKGNVERFVSEILSPATVFENISSLPISNNIASIYIEVQKENTKKDDYLLTIGLSYIDVTTGQNTVLEIYSKEKDAIFGIQETFRFLNSIRPRELILNLQYKNGEKLKEYEKYLITELELDKIPNYMIFSNKIESEYFKLDYCTRFLTKIFNPSVNERIIIKNPRVIEELNLERLSYGLTSYILLLQYCYEHDQNLIEKISKPNVDYLDSDKFLVLTYNASLQIDVHPPRFINNKRNGNRNKRKIDSLFSVINYTKTALGRRYLENIISNPITNIKELNEIYDMNESLIGKPEILKTLSNFLKEIPDLERYHRKLLLKKIKPNEFVTLFKSYNNLIYIYQKLCDEKLLKKILFDPTSFNSCLKFVYSNYNLDNLEKAEIKDEKLKIEENIFVSKIDEKSDKYVNDIGELKNKIETIIDHLNFFIIKTKGKKIELSEKKKKNLGFIITAHKAKILKESSWDKTIVGELSFTNILKEVFVTSDIIGETLSNLSNYSEEFSKYLYECYISMLNKIATNYKFFETLNNFISKLDYICSNSKCAIENKYFRPTIKEGDSFLEILDIRHPIVECIIDSEYITNDIFLGNGKENGMLLYGQNSSGKSTLAKAVACNLILAQAGLFTAGRTTFSPYKKIITRLSCNDNIINGESSFIVEMKELRTILRNSDESTLILGDEVTRGTESFGGLCIASSAILTILKKKSSFIFSSHLHDLVNVRRIIEVKDKLNICHLVLKCDDEKKIIVYDRKLKPGTGETIYGIEIAKSLDLDPDFIKTAYEIRNELLGSKHFLSTKKSNYNGKYYVDSCVSCKKKDLSKLESHHIKPQRDSDENGFIGTMHKNIPSNLIDICEDCHDKIDSNKLKILSEETSKGTSLILS
jgi:DNA mismatch repair protein MutS